MLEIVTWNVNSIRSRLNHLLDFLERRKPDIVLLQELKLEDPAFPYEMLEERGYRCAVFGQKTYNGVAILSRHPLEDISRGLACDRSSAQARYIEAVVCPSERTPLRVASIYVPNGQSPDSDKFAYKLDFMQCLSEHVETLLAYEEVLVLGGDYNIAPGPLDVYDSPKLDGTICYHPREREALRRIDHQGLYDAWRSKHPREKGFTWWDYRQNGFEQNAGMRIDHLLLSAEAVDRLQTVEIEFSERAREKPSDHAPVICRLGDAP